MYLSTINRSLNKFSTFNIIYKRFISTSIISMEKVMETLEKNPYYEKYSKKISELQKASPDEFLNRAEKVLETPSNQDESEQWFSAKAEKGKAPLPQAAYAFAPQKKLESIMKTELLADRTTDEIKYIWTQHFLQKDAISGIMPLDLFEKIQENAVKYPMFLFPLPRNQGYEFVYVQFAANEIHFTPLINYQAYQENAPECLTMVHYTELSKEKGIVLMHGTFNKDIISSKEAQFLANQVTLYYGGKEKEKLDLLKTFHESPNTFKHMDLVEQIEKLDLSSFVENMKK